jgi:hypothetical protein
MRLATPLAIVALATALLAGCGGSSPGSGSTSSTIAPKGSGTTAPAGASTQKCETQAVDAGELQASDVSCEEARRLLLGWQRQPSCARPQGASRSACTVRSYRCLSVSTSRGLAVGCARRGKAIAFIAKRR